MIRRFYEALKNKIITFCLSNFSSLSLGKKVVFKNIPLVLKHPTAIIEIGENTTINSSNYGYHINMHTPCKLYADRASAIIKIGARCRIHGTCIHAYNRIIIGNNCLIAANSQIIDGHGHKLSFDNTSDRINTTDEGVPIIIEDDVWIGANCIIFGGSHIGKGAVISAGSIIKGNVPENSIYGGNPAKIIKQY